MLRAGIILIVIVVVILTIMSFITPDSGEKVLERLKEKNIYPVSKIISYHDSLRIKVVTVGDTSKPALLLIHGSPGDWSAWENIITNDSVRAQFYILTIDRAGFGETTVPALVSVNDQADVVWQVMEYESITNNITIAGHSYGGAIVEQLLINYADAFDLAVLVAPTLSPDLMQPRWYNKVAKWKLVNKIISQDLKSSNLEMLGLPASLELNKDAVNSIETPIVYIQGKKDVLVDHETVDYFHRLKPKGVKYVIIDDMNHFTPWSDPYLITDAILGKSVGNSNPN
jgi:pimeloyl-ACP methyl ester carboxylesterase